MSFKIANQNISRWKDSPGLLGETVGRLECNWSPDSCHNHHNWRPLSQAVLSLPQHRTRNRATFKFSKCLHSNKPFSFQNSTTITFDNVNSSKYFPPATLSYCCWLSLPAHSSKLCDTWLSRPHLFYSRLLTLLGKVLQLQIYPRHQTLEICLLHTSSKHPQKRKN